MKDGLCSMIKNTYSCDLCGDILQESWDKPVKKGFIGIEYNSYNKLVRRDHRKTARHICSDCARDISIIYNNMEVGNERWIV